MEYLQGQVWITMDNLNFDWQAGFGMKSLWGGDYCGVSISQIACVGDLSDGNHQIPSDQLWCAFRQSLGLI